METHRKDLHFAATYKDGTEGEKRITGNELSRSKVLRPDNFENFMGYIKVRTHSSDGLALLVQRCLAIIYEEGAHCMSLSN